MAEEKRDVAKRAVKEQPGEVVDEDSPEDEGKKDRNKRKGKQTIETSKDAEKKTEEDIQKAFE